MSVTVVNSVSNPANVAIVSGDVGGTVAVSNFPATQPVSGTIGVGNFPVTQPVSGTVSVSNFPATQPVSGTVSVSSGSVTVSNFPGTQSVSGTVTVSNLSTTQMVRALPTYPSNLKYSLVDTRTIAMASANTLYSTGVFGTVSSTSVTCVVELTVLCYSTAPCFIAFGLNFTNGGSSTGISVVGLGDPPASPSNSDGTDVPIFISTAVPSTTVRQFVIPSSSGANYYVSLASWSPTAANSVTVLYAFKASTAVASP